MSISSALVVCRKGDPGLLGSYGRAMLQLGLDVNYWDLRAALDQTTKYGRPGRILASRVPIEPWINAANRKLIVEVMARRPGVVLIAATMQVRAGALAQIKTSCPDAALVLVWPDPMQNLDVHTIAALPMYDMVASYSSAAIPQFHKLGARNVIWLPFGADPELFPADVQVTASERAEFGCDVGFIGNHRPERERAILRLLDIGLSVKVWGGDSWVKQAAPPSRASSYYQGRVLEGVDWVKAARCWKMSLNVIDQTNYPAANMRFFETHACGGVSLSSRCPELEAEFPHLKTTSYFDEENLEDRARELVADEALRKRLAAEGTRHVLASHTYVHRTRELLSALENV